MMKRVKGAELEKRAGARSDVTGRLVRLGEFGFYCKCNRKPFGHLKQMN